MKEDEKETASVIEESESPADEDTLIDKSVPSQSAVPHSPVPVEAVAEDNTAIEVPGVAGLEKQTMRVIEKLETTVKTQSIRISALEDELVASAQAAAADISKLRTQIFEFEMNANDDDDDDDFSEGDGNFDFSSLDDEEDEDEDDKNDN
eukprot:CAMPEP_0182429782 /NCGR_PEP_ID=MMETSP1167-20130531/33803_1 /TAXON_ID=2988 /ORGANISM="Mallomonas Sp, Strain CCMP3275" /LENGTH=149 /DNA_ID=CAMNT_0024614027 /DNA_START=37 /DNA_END=486 /DNA_ORIENTATION=-